MFCVSAPLKKGCPFLGLLLYSGLYCTRGRPNSPGPAEVRSATRTRVKHTEQTVVMPTKKAETAAEENIAAGEAKPRRVSKRAAKPAAPMPPGEDGAVPAPKTTRRKSTVARTAAQSVEHAEAAEIQPLSAEDIAVRAYFIGENRQALGLEGDSESDWLEAERQLTSERLGIAASLKRK